MVTRSQMPRITEDQPSSGDKPCQHIWKQVTLSETESPEETKRRMSIPDGHMMLVCDKCPETKLVKLPTKVESKGEAKPLLMEKEDAGQESD
jgi:hypothetical protein